MSSLDVKFASVDEEKQVVYGIVLQPDEVDLQFDTISAEEIQKAAWKYLQSPVIGLRHKESIPDARPVESYIAPCAFELGGETVKAGSWAMAVHIESETLWKSVKSGELSGFSIGAFVSRIPV